MEFLEIVDAGGRRRRVELNRPRLLIGREPNCDVCLPHASVSRRHAQLQRTESGLWMLQDLNSLNHVYLDNRPVQQILMEPGLAIRIADYRLALVPTPNQFAPERKTLPLDDSSALWSVLDTGWLEHMQEFERALLRLEEPRQVLERLAGEFVQVARPELVAVGLAGAEGYRWDVVMAGKSAPDEGTEIPDLSSLLTCEDSEIKSWIPDAVNGQTPQPSSPQCMLFPMKGRGTILGHVYVQRPRLAPMPPAMQCYLALLATQAGLVRENLQLAALRVAQKVIEQELRQAREIQTELFPATTEIDPRVDVHAVNLPSVQVSGDYYDLVRTGPDTVAFVIADAMGHGMPAALMMAAVRASLRMGLAAGLAWPAIFQGLDGIIAQARAGAFVTGIVGQIDLEAKRLDLVCAGHYLPSLLVDGQRVLLPETCQTRPWGLDFESPWQVGRVELGDSDWSLLCFTDGVTEAVIKSGDLFGNSGVVDFHRRNCALCAEDLCQGLIGEVAARQSSGSLNDDQTVLVLRSIAGEARRSTPTQKLPVLK
jgi:sigma-B regulation protein RsbU (phosphoserine phosphatase)